MADYISPVFQTGEEVDEALVAGLQSKAALVDIVDGGAKNKLSWSVADKTHNGVTFTVNGDGTVTASGTNNGSANSSISIKILTTAEIGAFTGYVLSGTPENEAGAYISLEERGGSYRTYTRDRGESAEIPEISTEVNVYIVIPKNATVTDMVFKPMICSKEAWDISQTYQPYRPSYQTLYDMVLALQSGNSLSSVQSTAQLASLNAINSTDIADVKEENE